MPSPPDAVRSARRPPGRADPAERHQAERHPAGLHRAEAQRQADRAVQGLPEPQRSAAHSRLPERAGAPAEAEPAQTERTAEVLPARQAEWAVAAERAAKRPARDAHRHRSRNHRLQTHPATGCWECSPTLRSSRMVCGSNTYRLNRHLPAASRCLS